jgi:protein-tyrosine phosphatase
MELNVSDKRNISYELKKIIAYLDRNIGPGMHYFSEITPHIYISNWNASLDTKILRSYEITEVINLSGNHKPEKIKFNYKKRAINEWTIIIGDSESDPIDEYFDKTYYHIHALISQNKKILIHGQDGISRSVIIIAHYLLRRYYLINYKNEIIQDELISRYFTSDIIKFIKMNRTCANPNQKFIYLLLIAELNLKHEFEPLIIHLHLEKERKLKLQEQNKSDISEDSADENNNNEINNDENNNAEKLNNSTEINNDEKKDDEKKDDETNNEIEKSSNIQHDKTMMSEKSESEDYGFTDDDDSANLYDN